MSAYFALTPFPSHTHTHTHTHTHAHTHTHTHTHVNTHTILTLVPLLLATPSQGPDSKPEAALGEGINSAVSTLAQLVGQGASGLPVLPSTLEVPPESLVAEAAPNGATDAEEADSAQQNW